MTKNEDNYDSLKVNESFNENDEDDDDDDDGEKEDEDDDGDTNNENNNNSINDNKSSALDISSNIHDKTSFINTLLS